MYWPDEGKLRDGTETELRVVIVDDSESDALLSVAELKRSGFAVFYRRVANPADLQQALSETWDLVLSNFRLREIDATAALKILRESNPDIPFIVIADAIDEDAAVKLMQVGAADAIVKTSLKRLAPVAERELRGVRHLRAAQQSEKDFRLLTENSADLITRHHSDGKIRYVSPSYERVLGYAAGELVGKSPRKFVHPEDVRTLTQAYKKVLQAPSEVKVESRVRHRSGHYLWLETILRSVAGSPDQPNGEIFSVARDISQRKIAELRLRENENFLTSAINCQLNGVLVVDKEGVITLANESAEQILQLEKDTQTGKYAIDPELWTFIDMENEPLPVDQLPMLQALRDSKKVTDAQYGVVFPRGNLKWLSVSASPIINDAGEVLGAVGSYLDITQIINTRNRNQFQLQQLKLQEEALNNSNSGVIIADARLADLPVVYVNAAFTNITGYEAYEVLGRNCRFLHGDEGDQAGLHALRLMIRNRQSGEVLLRNFRKDGRMFYSKLSLTPVRNEADELHHFVAIQTDVTEKILTERQLEIGWQRMQLALRGAQLGLIDIDFEKNETYYSTRFAEIVGYIPAELHEGISSWHDLVHPEEAEQAEKMTADLISGKIEQLESEIRLQHKSGHWVWVLIRGKIIERTEAGKAKRSLGTILDISERKEQERKIFDLTQNLIQIAEIERAEISGELHDVVGQSLVLLKLNVMKFLQANNLRTDEHERALIQPIANTLQQVRDISRRLTPSHMEKVGLGLALEDMLQSAANLANLRIAWDLKALEGFFPNDWNIQVFRIVQEALTNALKHAGASEIFVRTRRLDENLEVVIGDNGAGFRGEGEIAGLGLKIMRERVRGLRGHIFWESGVSGTQVHVLLPAQTMVAVGSST